MRATDSWNACFLCARDLPEICNVNSFCVLENLKLAADLLLKIKKVLNSPSTSLTKLTGTAFQKLSVCFFPVFWILLVVVLLLNSVLLQDPRK